MCNRKRERERDQLVNKIKHQSFDSQYWCENPNKDKNEKNESENDPKLHVKE